MEKKAMYPCMDCDHRFVCKHLPDMNNLLDNLCAIQQDGNPLFTITIKCSEFLCGQGCIR